MQIQLFITCLVDSIHPQIGQATIDLLERLNVSVKFPSGQTCCGQPAYNAGYHNEAKPVAKRLLDTFAQTDGPIVTPSGSCASMIKHGFPDLFRDDQHNLTRAQEIAERTYELSQFIVHVLGVTNVGAYFDGSLTYHPSCHLLRGLGERTAPLQLLKEVEGAKLVPLPGADECCGFGGLFSIKMSSLSAAIATRKTSNITTSGASTCVTCDAGCLMNITGHLARNGQTEKCVHLAEILAGQDKS